MVENQAEDHEQKCEQEQYNLPLLKKRRITLHECLRGGCSRKFKNPKSFQQHVELNNCNLSLLDNTQSKLSDRTKTMYANKLDSYVESTNVVLNTTVHTNESSTILARGWALKGHKSRTVFSKKQINYTKEKFDVGKKLRER